MRSFSLKNPGPTTSLHWGWAAANILTLGYIFGFINPGDLDTDGGIFAAIAYKDLHGGTLYADAWDNKPPGIFYFLELFFLLIPHQVYALYCFSVIGILALANGLWLLAYRLTGSVWISLLILASFILVAVNGYFMSDGLYTEIFGSAFIIWGLYAYHQYCNKEHIKFVYISAFLIGTTVWLKEPFVFLVIPIAVMLAIQLRQPGAILKMFLVLILPSLLFIVLLWVNGSLRGFMEMELGNFGMSGSKSELISSIHLEVLWGGVLRPLLIVVTMIIYYGLKRILKKELGPEVFFNGVLLAGGLCFIIVSPYNYGHYYIPFILVLFYTLISFLSYEQRLYNGSPVILIVLLAFTVWKLDQDYVRRFKVSFKAYQPDNITQILRSDAGATLFVDHSPVSEYYIKSEKVFRASQAILIAVHLSNNAEGLKKFNRMFEELKAIRPDYLITNSTCSEIYRRFNDPALDISNYEKRDSAVKFGEPIFLWKRKKDRL